MLSRLAKSKIFLPKEWANSIIDWVTGLYSPSGTIKVANTATPNENGGCQIDVNVPILYQALKAYISQDFVANKTETPSSVAMTQTSYNAKSEYSKMESVIKGDATVRMNSTNTALDVYNDSGVKVGTLKWT